MPFFGLAILSFLGSLIAFVLANHNGGADGGVVIRDQVFTGTTLYAVAALLLAASGLFVISAVMKAIRRVATIVAVLALAGGGSVGALSGTTFTDYVKDHACATQKGEIADQCGKHL